MNTTEGGASRREALDRLRDMAREFASAYPKYDQHYGFPHDEIAKLKAAGMMRLSVPEAFGGLGIGIRESLEVTTLLAESFPSLSQVFGVHSGMVMTLIELGRPEQVEPILRRVIDENLFIGNATSERGSASPMSLETKFTEHPSGEGVVIQGKKFFTTGSLAADLLVVFGLHDGGIGVAVAPVDSEGLVIHDDWRAMGQRGTASGTIEFNNVHVPPELVLPKMEFLAPDPGSLLGPTYQLGFSAMYIGMARGALAHAVEYVRTQSRPWMESGVTRAVEDPYVLSEVGTLRAYLSAAEGLVDRAADRFDEVIAARQGGAGDALAERRAEAAVAVAEAKVVCTEVALRVCQDMFQVMGARSTLAENRLDRFWRDVRTLTLHDPKPYKAKLIGEYVLQDKRPAVSLLT